METRTEKIQKFLDSLNIDLIISEYVDCDNANSYEDVREQIEDSDAFNQEVIYYSTAIEYLKENDCSLHRSLELAEEMGYSPSKLNSEILASLLKSDIVREQFYELEDEIETFFNELEDEDNEETKD